MNVHLHPFLHTTVLNISLSNKCKYNRLNKIVYYEAQVHENELLMTFAVAVVEVVVCFGNNLVS